jgi:GT2 family glycosyltransferase
MLVDGSPQRDNQLAQELKCLGVQYTHCGGELSFSETFNTGINKTVNKIVVVLTNDIFIEAKQLQMLAGEIKNDVACAFSYLSWVDYGAARARSLPVPWRSFPNGMSFNVAAFSREALEKVGLIPEQMTGCYNDVVLFIRLREEGYSIVLRNVGYVLHMGQQTLKTGSTNVSYEADAAFFTKHYPQYWRNGRVLLHKVAQRWTTRMLYAVVVYLPVGIVERLRIWNWVWAIEPYICAEKGTYKECLIRLYKCFLLLNRRKKCPMPSLQK